MAPRANWKGQLRVGEVSAAIALYTAASTAERIAFNTISRATGHRVERHFVDSETGEPVSREDQVKGYDNGSGDPVIFEPEEIAAAVPESDKTLTIKAFLPCDSIDDVYLDKPYYLAPADRHAEEAFVLIRDGMRAEKVAALAEAVLFRRVRLLLVRPHEHGLIGTTLNFDYEVRSSKEAFRDVPRITVKGEMLDLARHIIATKAGSFDPAAFDDRYEAALAELVKAKIEGRPLPKPKAVRKTKSGDLLTALRESAGLPAAKGQSKAKAAAKGSSNASPSNASPKGSAKGTSKTTARSSEKPQPRRKAG